MPGSLTADETGFCPGAVERTTRAVASNDPELQVGKASCRIGLRETCPISSPYENLEIGLINPLVVSTAKRIAIACRELINGVKGFAARKESRDG
jgi:hypothetical protein